MKYKALRSTRFVRIERTQVNLEQDKIISSIQKSAQNIRIKYKIFKRVLINHVTFQAICFERHFPAFVWTCNEVMMSRIEKEKGKTKTNLSWH